MKTGTTQTKKANEHKNSIYHINNKNNKQQMQINIKLITTHNRKKTSETITTIINKIQIKHKTVTTQTQYKTIRKAHSKNNRSN